MEVFLSELEKSDRRYRASKDIKTRADFDVEEFSAMHDELVSTEMIKGNIIKDDQKLDRRKEMIKRAGHEPVDFAFERAIGKNDSVYTNFIELIADAKRKVCRIVVKRGIQRVGFATGFMVSENLMLTNWHVFRSIDDVDTSSVQFNYELNGQGSPSKAVSFNLSPSTFFYSFRALDYCLVGVDPIDISGQHKLADIGYISLEPKLAKLGSEDVERLNIIHHPEGDYKQLSIRENQFTKILPTTLWYKSDTAPGSSGSPVFNDQWQVVALHHMGVAKKNDQGQYLDKDGAVIPIADNKIDISRIHWIANEGIRISVIRNHIKAQFPDSDIVAKLIDSDGTSGPEVSDQGRLPEVPLRPDYPTNDSVNISIPSALLESQKTININITANDVLGNLGTGQAAEQPDFVGLDIEEESLRLERSMDYSSCRGYETDFLGDDFRVPIPKPQKSVRNYVAKIGNSRAYVLKYHKFSVIFNDFKKMPFISVINIDGDSEKRQDFTKRKDAWIRDTRIDLDSQLNNSFYKKSGFDRGHMSRREDANWGDDALEAKRNADLTCVHTNACPQVPELNRSNRGGLWGKLEKIVLENGAIKENGKTGKISVFSGPIFNANDPIYKGVKIPLEYYKVIMWKDKSNKLKATSFTLSQSDLVDEIDFEDLGIDQNINFKEHQISLKDLQTRTQIDFSDIMEFDTFKGDGESTEINDENHLLEILMT